ncbi:MAG: hypothetical protein ACYC46_09920 [Acidobacteriaceae bacterium]
MTTSLHTALTAAVDTAAHVAGMKILSAEAGTDFNGEPTARFTLGLSLDTHKDRTLDLELSDQFDFNKPELLPEMTRYLQEATKRLRNPRPDCYVSLAGLPISYGGFRWPFHRSTSGSDTYVVHGEVKLEDGQGSPLHAKVSASMTVTFAEIVPAAEQPYAENFIYNAIRKTLDRGQLEMLKSGNRQPVPVTTRYYSRWQHKFIFTDTTDAARMDFLALKIYWLSSVLGGNEPVWIADPRDAQYLNTDADQLQKMATALAGEGLLQLADGGEYASATPALLSLASEYQQKLQEALNFTKPAFNEEMRAGHTNM